MSADNVVTFVHMHQLVVESVITTTAHAHRAAEQVDMGDFAISRVEAHVKIMYASFTQVSIDKRLA